MNTQKELLDEANRTFPAYWKERRSVKQLPELDPLPKVEEVDMHRPLDIDNSFYLTFRVNGEIHTLEGEFLAFASDAGFRWEFARFGVAPEISDFANEYFAHLANCLERHGHVYGLWGDLPKS